MLETFIHCKDLRRCYELHWLCTKGVGIQPMSPPFGFMNSGILEVLNDDFEKLKKHEKVWRLIEMWLEIGYITEIISESEDEES